LSDCHLTKVVDCEFFPYHFLRKLFATEKLNEFFSGLDVVILDRRNVDLGGLLQIYEGHAGIIHL
jgi:hypothetical protein